MKGNRFAPREYPETPPASGLFKEALELEPIEFFRDPETAEHYESA